MNSQRRLNEQISHHSLHDSNDFTLQNRTSEDYERIKHKTAEREKISTSSHTGYLFYLSSSGAFENK